MGWWLAFATVAGDCARDGCVLSAPPLDTCASRWAAAAWAGGGPAPGCCAASRGLWWGHAGL